MKERKCQYCGSEFCQLVGGPDGCEAFEDCPDPDAVTEGDRTSEEKP